jgi:phosphate transport system substrate-binding protein
MRNWRILTALLLALAVMAAACGGEDNGELLGGAPDPAEAGDDTEAAAAGDAEQGDDAEAGGDLEGELTGAGATFPAPLYQDWTFVYQGEVQPGVTINYQSIGSGGGIEQFLSDTVDWGTSERYLRDEDLEEAADNRGCEAIQVPIVYGSVVIAFNDPALDGMVLDAKAISDIFRREITSFSDPYLQDLNPDMDLPDLDIIPVHRSDGSGTTNVWTNYLTRVSDEWRSRVGYATSVNWPTGIGGNGNEGVAGMVQNTMGAIGYNSLSYALLNNMSYGSVINQSGNTIEPGFAATSEAANIDLPEDTRILFTNTPAEYGYPIAGFAWMLVYENLEQNNAIRNRRAAEELVRFLIWCITDGQNLSEELGYAKLSDAAVERSMNMIRQLKWNGEEIGRKILEDGRPV